MFPEIFNVTIYVAEKQSFLEDETDVTQAWKLRAMMKASTEAFSKSVTP